ncbi:MAG: hypothetical protein IPK60_25165 [Sandaracinaceae bacterium]|nr:hypothetical protein [Sandaracinaceae bacterium]
MSGNGGKIRGSAFAFIVCAFAYFYVFPYQPDLNNPNENVRLYMTAALVENHSYQIDEVRARWGWVNDAGVRDGHFYSVKAPGTSMLGVPGYFLYYTFAKNFDRTTALWVCRATASMFPTVLFLVFFYRWLRRRAKSGVLAESVFYSVAIGSLLYGYGMMFVSHTQSAAAAFVAFALLAEAREKKKLSGTAAFVAGLCTAGVTFFEYPGFVVSVVLAVYALACVRPWKRLVPFAIGGALPTLLMMHFQWRSFGSPFRPGHLFVENPAFRAAHEQGFFGADGFHADGARGLFFDTGFGLFPLTPILFFAFVGWVLLLRRRRDRTDALAALAITLGTGLVISLMNNWRGGWTIGPRYLAVVVPFVAWPALAGLEWIAAKSKPLAAGLALGTAAIGFVASGIPSAYYPHLPEPVTRPVAQIFVPLIENNFAPLTALHYWDVFGTTAMYPLLIVAAAALIYSLRLLKNARERIIASVIAVAVAAIGIHAFATPDDPPNADAQREYNFITSHWQPAPREPGNL